MPSDEVTLNEAEASLANAIRATDGRLEQNEVKSARLLGAGMKAPTPLGAGLYRTEELTNEAEHDELLRKRAGLVEQLKASRAAQAGERGQ